MRKRLQATNAVALAAALLCNSACTTLNDIKTTFIGSPATNTAEPARLTGFIGAAVADEPRAALAGRDVLAIGGTAADAAVAMAFMLAVTLPSRAGLGGGGACIAYSPNRDGPGKGAPESILFTPVAPSNPGPASDRPAAVPMLARGLFALHARYGKRRFESLIAPAEGAARLGVPVSRSLGRDLAVVGGALAADPNARAIFAPNGRALGEGGQLVQSDLGATLAQLATAGVGDLYQGGLSRRLIDGSQSAGGALQSSDLRAALPRTAAPLVVRANRDSVAFLPPPADGGLAAAASFLALQSGAAATAQARGLGAAARWRAGGGDPEAILAAPNTGFLPSLPASTGLVATDRDGNAVACALTMDNLFGTGRVVPGTGILLAASPRAVAPPLLSAAVAWNTNLRAFHAGVAGSGQDGAGLAVAVALANALGGRTAMPAPVPEPGRTNVILCAEYLPDHEGSCTWATDPRGSGLASGSN